MYKQGCLDAEQDEQLLDIIRETLSKLRDDVGNSVKIVGLHRKYKGKLPTPLILLKTETAAAQQYLLNNDFELQQHTLKTRLYIPKTELQCTNCHTLGHTKHTCKNEHKCVRCGQDCPIDNCTNKYKKCNNCNGPHSSTHTNCDKIQQHMNRRQQLNTTKTYAQALNKRQHELELTIQKQADTITELQSSVTELRQTIKNLKTTEATNVKIRNTQIKEIKDKQQYPEDMAHAPWLGLSNLIHMPYKTLKKRSGSTHQA